MKKVVLGTMSILLIIVGIEACSDMGKNVVLTPPTPSPAITAIQPDSAAVGDIVTITGHNFGAAQGSSIVRFTPGITATSIILWKEDSIKAKVPVGAVTGSVAVSVGGVSSNALLLKTPVTLNTTVSFSADILQAILIPNCAISGCHRGSSASGNFNQESYEGVRAGGFSYGTSVVIPFDSTNSGIMKMIRGTNNLYNLRMPLSGQYSTTGLPDSLIVKIGTWIKEGAYKN